MNCCYKCFGGGMIFVNGEDVFLKSLWLKEKCKLWDIIAIRFQTPTAIHMGHIDIYTRRQHDTSYTLLFWGSKKELILGQFYQSFLKELKQYHDNPGTFIGGWWTWS